MADEASSEFNRSQFVAELTILSASTGRWEVDSANPLVETRPLSLQLRAGEIFKGEQVAAGGVLSVEATQSRPTTGRMAQNYGPWAFIEIAKGDQLVVFGSVSGGGPRALRLVADNVVDIPDPAYPFLLTDLQFIDRALASGRNLTEIVQDGRIAEAIGRDTPAGPVLARWLRDLASELPPGEALEALALLTERANGHAIFYTDLTTAMAEIASLHDDIDPLGRAAAVRAMLYVLNSREERYQQAAGPIVQSYLANLVFSDSSVLVDPRIALPSEAARSAAQQTIQAKPFAPDIQAKLLAWLRSG